MAIKTLISLVTLASANEQASASSITVTSTGTSREYREIGSFQRAIIFLDVSAVSGSTPTLAVALQVQDPVSQKWSQVAVFTMQSATTGATPIPPITLELYGLNYRTSWTVAGSSPSFTFSLCAVLGAEESII